MSASSPDTLKAAWLWEGLVWASLLSVLSFGLSVCLIHMGFQGSTLCEGCNPGQVDSSF